MAYEQQIAKGVALLNEKVPDWLDRIDLDRLDLKMGDFHRGSCGCVLAQVEAGPRDWGNFWDGKRLLGLGTDGPFELGFDLNVLESTRANYDALTAEWKAEIVRLRAERGASQQEAAS